MGDTQPPSNRARSCGLEFDVSVPSNRRWRLSTEWTRKALRWIMETYDDADARHRQIFAGLSLWTMSATLRPPCHIRRTLEGSPHEAERSLISELLRDNRWRRLRSVPTVSTPVEATVVITDASMHGAGIVADGYAYALPWSHQRTAQDQQKAEWDAARLGIEQACRRTRKGGAILLVADNVGILATLITGNPSSRHGIDAICHIQRVLRGALWCTFVPSGENPADAPSRQATSSKVAVTPWPPPQLAQWRSKAILATWSMADDDE